MFENKWKYWGAGEVEVSDGKQKSFLQIIFISHPRYTFYFFYIIF